MVSSFFSLLGYTPKGVSGFLPSCTCSSVCLYIHNCSKKIKYLNHENYREKN